MELEELKDKWKILSDEVAGQKLVIKEMLEKAVKDKVKTMVSDYKYAAIISYVLIAILLWLIFSLDFPYKTLAVLFCALGVIILIWGHFALRNLNKAISPTLSICKREQYMMQYKKQERLCYILEIVIILPVFVLWVICFEGVTGVPLWLSILKIVIFLAILYGSTASSLKKMKKIEESFKEYKEFMEKEK